MKGQSVKTTIVCALAVFSLMTRSAPSGGAEPQQSNSERAVAAQLLLNLQAGVVISPRLNDKLGWGAEAQRILGETTRACSLIVFIQIDSGLLDAAVAHWSEGKSTTQQEKEQAIRKLQKKFLRPKERAFLMLIKPIARTEPTNMLGQEFHRADFTLSFGSIDKNLKLETLESHNGEVVRAEKTFDDPLNADSGVKSCLLYIKDVVDPENDPSFNLVLSNVKYATKAWNGGWIEAAKPITVRFRFETGEVRLLDILDKGTPWDFLETKYIGPKKRLLDSEYANFGFKYLVDLSRELLVQVILKGL